MRDRSCGRRGRPVGGGVLALLLLAHAGAALGMSRSKRESPASTARTRAACTRTAPGTRPVCCLVVAESRSPSVAGVEMREKVREMFTHAYDGYMRYAFPHDELKPLSRTWTDSLVELGNAQHVTRAGYTGVALTLIDSLDTLAVLGNATEFARGVRWVGAHVSFDQDIDVHVFETTIRLLGGLLSAHLLAAGQCRGAEHMA